MAKTLIVNADDYGLAPAVSAGIRAAHLNGLVTSTTAMMNMPGAAGALRLAQSECPRLGLGLHLVLTAGRPVLPPDQLRSLVDLAGGERFPSLAVFMANLAAVDVNQVKAEWRAQAERFVAAAGRSPTHFDSHHHTSYFTPALFRAMLELAAEHGAAIRMPVTTLAVAQSILGLPPSSHLVEQFLTQVQQVLAEAPRQRRPDHFEPRFYGDQATPELLQAIIAELPDGATEIMCHPALDDPALDAVTSYGSRARARELAALTSPASRAAVDAAGARLASFAAL